MEKIRIKISALVGETSKGVGENIRKAREDLGLSQGECAERVGISQGQLSRIEQGKRLPSFKVFLKLTGVLNVTADEIATIAGDADGAPVLDKGAGNGLPASDKRNSNDRERGGGGGACGGGVPVRIDVGGWKR